MKKRELEKRLRRMGWRLLRHGANHDLWTNGEDIVTVPRHGEIVEMTARRVLNEARRYGS